MDIRVYKIGLHFTHIQHGKYCIHIPEFVFFQLLLKCMVSWRLKIVFYPYFELWLELYNNRSCAFY